MSLLLQRLKNDKRHSLKIDFMLLLFCGGVLVFFLGGGGGGGGCQLNDIRHTVVFLELNIELGC